MPGMKKIVMYDIAVGEFGVRYLFWRNVVYDTTRGGAWCTIPHCRNYGVRYYHQASPHFIDAWRGNIRADHV